MYLSFNQKLIGTPINLIYDVRDKRFIKKRFDVDWHVDGETCVRKNKSIDDLLALNGQNIDKLVPKRFIDVFASLNIDEDQVLWSYALPDEITKFRLKKIVNNTIELFSKVDLKYYEDVFSKNNDILFGLSRANIDLNEYEKALCGNQTHVVSTFKPDVDGYANPIGYDRFSARTGRLTTKFGPNALILAKDHRKILKSRYKNGKIMLFDYVSFEAQVALSLVGKKPVSDVYDLLMRNIFNDLLPRSIIKQVSLAYIFGMGRKLFQKTTGLSNRELDSITKELDDFFKTEKLSEIASYSNNKLINWYGRSINLPNESQHLKINSLVQSTAVDAALFGFSKLGHYIKNNQIDAKPLFVIHDGLIVDMSENALQRQEELKKECQQIHGFSNEFPVRLIDF